MRQQGVTLIQMMCTLALASLLTSLGAIAYKGLTEDLYQATAARELGQALRDARNRAALAHQAVLVQPLENNWGNGWRTTFEHSGELLHEHRLTRALTISASTNREVRFSARGVPLRMGFGGITLDICQPPERTSRHQVVLSPSGRVSLRNDENRRCASG